MSGGKTPCEGTLSGEIIAAKVPWREKIANVGTMLGGRNNVCRYKHF
jgi:hypothetical protein